MGIYGRGEASEAAVEVPLFLRNPVRSEPEQRPQSVGHLGSECRRQLAEFSHDDRRGDCHQAMGPERRCRSEPRGRKIRMAGFQPDIGLQEVIRDLARNESENHMSMRSDGIRRAVPSRQLFGGILQEVKRLIPGGGAEPFTFRYAPFLNQQKNPNRLGPIRVRGGSRWR